MIRDFISSKYRTETDFSKNIVKKLTISVIMKEDDLKEVSSMEYNMENKWNDTDRQGYVDKTKKADARSRIVEREMLVAQARQFNLLSNVFMSVALEDKAACQHILRIITGIKGLVVLEVRSQYRVSKITSHDAILDILAEDGCGRIFSIEIQRSDTIDHARRIRFYEAMIDSEYLMKGKTYADLPDVYIIYISETDLWKGGCTSYPVEKYLGNIKVPYDDGQHILYVNAAVDDGSDIARLMQYFKTADPNDMSQGDLSKRIHFLKCEEGGYEIMCEVSDKIFAEGEKSGEERINKLNTFLLQEKRYEDLERSIYDKEFQEQLMLQYGV